MTTFPSPGTRLGPLLVVGDVSTSRDFYRDILGATATREMEGSL